MTPLRCAGPVAAVLAALAASAACAPDVGPPEIVLDRSACARCGMLISEPRFAAAYRTSTGAEVFDDIGCLLDALDSAAVETGPAESAAGADSPRAAVWFLDRDQRWISSEEVIFVRSTALATPMHGNIEAFASLAEAEDVAARTGGSIVHSLSELRASWRGGTRGDRS
jgi:copper chaperone NosL